MADGADWKIGLQHDSCCFLIFYTSNRALSSNLADCGAERALALSSSPSIEWSMKTTLVDLMLQNEETRVPKNAAACRAAAQSYSLPQETQSWHCVCWPATWPVGATAVPVHGDRACVSMQSPARVRYLSMLTCSLRATSKGLRIEVARDLIATTWLPLGSRRLRALDHVCSNAHSAWWRGALTTVELIE